MNKVFLFVLWAFGLISCFVPYMITSQLYPLTFPEWIETEGTYYTEKRVAHSSGFLMSLALCAIYVYKTLAIATSLCLNLLKWKEIIVVLVTILMLSGISHALRYSSPIHYFGTATVATLYALGFAGLITMYQSAKCKDHKKRWLLLFVGFITIFVAYFSLEILYNSYGGQ